jgi:hypothetical protein
LQPEGAKSEITFTSTRNTVATVTKRPRHRDQTGNAKNTAKTNNGKKCDVSVTVTKAPEHRHADTRPDDGGRGRDELYETSLSKGTASTVTLARTKLKSPRSTRRTAHMSPNSGHGDQHATTHNGVPIPPN